MNIAKRAKAIQTDSDIKIRTLAPHMGVSEHSLGNYLNGKRVMPYEVLVRFSNYFHVSTDYLLGLTDESALPFSISEKERALVLAYRQLSQEQRELIGQNIAFMNQQNQRG